MEVEDAMVVLLQQDTNLSKTTVLLDNNAGISPSVEYPYKGYPQSCQKTTGSFKISDYKGIYDCNELVNTIRKQPVTVTVDATKWSFYQSGIYNGCTSPPSLNHQVLLTGIADEYWKAKNSWGNFWG
jgi:hypothetical protein